jgi:hypothetical protein
MTTLIEEMRIAVRGIWQSIGFDASANTAATVVPVLVLGVALNLIALHVVDRVHPIKGKSEIVCVARAELALAQTVTASVFRQIGGHERGQCSVKQWASSWLAEMVHCRTATGLDCASKRTRQVKAFSCGEQGSSMIARRTVQAI